MKPRLLLTVVTVSCISLTSFGQTSKTLAESGPEYYSKHFYAPGRVTMINVYSAESRLIAAVSVPKDLFVAVYTDEHGDGPEAPASLEPTTKIGRVSIRMTDQESAAAMTSGTRMMADTDYRIDFPEVRVELVTHDAK